MSRSWLARLLVALALIPFVPLTPAQEKSVRPGINKDFENPDLQKFLGIFEGESREIFTQRKDDPPGSSRRRASFGPTRAGSICTPGRGRRRWSDSSLP